MNPKHITSSELRRPSGLLLGLQLTYKTHSWIYKRGGSSRNMFLLRSSYGSFKEICFLHSFFFFFLLFWGRSCSSSQTSSVVRRRFQHSPKNKECERTGRPPSEGMFVYSCLLWCDEERRDGWWLSLLTSSLQSFSLVVFWTCCCCCLADGPRGLIFRILIPWYRNTRCIIISPFLFLTGRVERHDMNINAMRLKYIWHNESEVWSWSTLNGTNGSTAWRELQYLT